jgi:hypothetical protein
VSNLKAANFNRRRAMPATRNVALALLTITFLVSIAAQAMAQNPAKSATSKRDAVIEKCIKEAQSMQGTTPGNPDRVAHYKACMKAAGQRP